jgi:hypothetical protein
MTIIEFQPFNWRDEDKPKNGDDPINGKYCIYGYGRTADDESVAVKVANFKPFFYIKEPPRSPDFDQKIVALLKNLRVDEDLKEEYKIDFWGYNNDKKEKFYCVRFHTKQAKQIARGFLKKKQGIGP